MLGFIFSVNLPYISGQTSTTESFANVYEHLSSRHIALRIDYCRDDAVFLSKWALSAY
jgi:hypothetical protein